MRIHFFIIHFPPFSRK